MEHGLSCSMACGVLLDQESYLCLLHWQADSLPVSHRGSPKMHVYFFIYFEILRFFISPCLPVPPLGLGLTMTDHFYRSSWNRLESSGTSPSTMACRISRRPWIGCSFRTPKWAISSLGSVPVHCSHVPHPRWAPRRTALGEQVTQPRRSVNQSEQEVASLPSSLGFPALSRAALFRPRKCLQRWGPRAGFSLDTHTLLLLHGPSCSPSPSCPLLCCPEVPSEVL